VRGRAAALLLLASSCYSPRIRVGDEPDWSVVKSELARRVDQDQALRREAMETDPMPPELVERVCAVDADNTAWMKDLVTRHGWPTRARVGEKGTSDAWLLVQHADQDVEFQEYCLQLLEAALRSDQVDPRNVAYLADRVATHRGRPQRYGTQFVDKDGELVPYELEDPKKVDEWRHELGLGPLAEYAEQLKSETKRSSSDPK
jgi:hypothetical protein